MKTVNRILFALTLGLSAMATASLRAQTLPVTVKLTMQSQDPSTFVNGVYTDKVRSTKVANADVLNMLGRAYSTDFPNGFPLGSSLVLIDYSYFQVLSPTGSILVTNASDFLTYSDTFVYSEFLYQGKEDTNTGALNYLYYYQSTIEFSDGLPDGATFTYIGNTVEKYYRSKPDDMGFRLNQGSLAINGMGTGFSGTNYFLLSGKITTGVAKWVN